MLLLLLLVFLLLGVEAFVVPPPLSVPHHPHASPPALRATAAASDDEAFSTPSSSSPASALRDLVDQGILHIVTRRPDYRDRRGDEYVEPEEIYIIGTAHTSKESAEAVSRVIREVKPCNVVLEMCKSRSGLTALNDSRLLDEVRLPTLIKTALFGLPSSSSTSSSADKTQEALARSLRLAGGRGPLVLQYCLVAAVKQLGKLLQVQFGEEFRCARRASEEVGAQVVLGDRPIELTLRRAWAAMAPEERGAVMLAMFSLLFGLRAKKTETTTTERGAVTATTTAAGGGGGIGAVSTIPFASASTASTMLNDKVLAVEGYKGANDELLESLQRFGSTFPSLYDALIQERDRYLAWAAKRSKAVNGSKRVVLVMGALHVPGVVAAIAADNGGNTLNFRNVARLPPLQEAGGQGIVLSAPYRKVLRKFLWAWVTDRGPHLLRDLVIGLAAGEALNLGWREWGQEAWEGALAAVPPSTTLPFL